MKRTVKYVALEVHQGNTLASVREGSGRVIARTLSTRCLRSFSLLKHHLRVGFHPRTLCLKARPIPLLT